MINLQDHGPPCSLNEDNIWGKKTFKEVGTMPNPAMPRHNVESFVWLEYQQYLPS